MKKLTWKDLLNELMAKSQQEGNQQDPIDLSQDSEEIMEDLRQEFEKIRSEGGGEEKQHMMVLPLFETIFEEHDEQTRKMFERLINVSEELTPEQIVSEIQRIQDLMSQDGLLSPRDVVQKLMDRRAQETPLNVVPGPRTLQ